MIKTGSRRSCFCLTSGLCLCAKISLCVKSTFPTAIAVFSSDKCTLFPFCCPIIGCLILEACRSPCDKQLAICFFFTETRATCSSFSLHMYKWNKWFSKPTRDYQCFLQWCPYIGKGSRCDITFNLFHVTCNWSIGEVLGRTI